jgi:Phosphotyrosyl phosphate activator (PTPA) protein
MCALVLGSCWTTARCRPAAHHDCGSQLYAPLQVKQGMFKMYQVEVLSKFPIMQHSLWGFLLPFPGTDASHTNRNR